MRRAAIPALLAAAVVALIVFEVATAGEGEGRPQPAPPLPPKVVQGPRATLATLRGRPALIDFWASWCEPCREEAPELAQLDRTLHGSATLVGVDYTDQPGPARSFIHRYGWRFPVLSDPTGAYGDRFGLSGLPTAIVLDPRGRIVEKLRGPQTEADLRAALAAGSGRS